MDNKKTHIRKLLEQKRLTEEDTRFMQDYFQQDDHADLQDMAKTLFDADLRESSKLENSIDENLSKEMLRGIHQRVRKERRLTWLPYAAAVLLMIGVGAWFYFAGSDGGRDEANVVGVDINPGGNRATLTLSDGKSIVLSDERNGIAMLDHDIKYNDGTDVVSVNANDSPNSQLSLQTPKGGQYQIKLSDGTTVWLNAASNLRYPEKFQGDERLVELDGEAYFDVSKVLDKHSKNIPFKVKTKDQFVEVLGTEFNINAYSNEQAVNTTLVNGRVKVFTSSGVSTSLIPGEQSSFKNGLIGKRTVEVRNYVSWKDGFIILDQSDISTVLRQIERWYDVQFDAHDFPKHTKLNGILHRNAQLAGVLDVLSINTGNKFQITGRRIMIK